MTYEERALAQLHNANDLGYVHPWPMILLLASAIVMALLTVADAITEAADR